MTLEQLKTYTVGVLKGWFSNKQVLDKLSESEDGNLLYNGNEITGSGSGSSNEPTEPVQPIVVGRKMYTLYGEQETGLVPWNFNNPVTASLLDSLENYDAVVLYAYQSDGSCKSTIVSNEIAVDHIKQNYGQPTIYLYGFKAGQFVEAWWGFTDATHVCIFINSIPNLTIAALYGIKYETVSADPITDAQVSEAVAETVEGLNAEDTE